jgi:hypothetical protein
LGLAQHRGPWAAHAARLAFTSSMSVTFTVGAAGVLALLAALVMRDTRPPVAPAEERELVTAR